MPWPDYILEQFDTVTPLGEVDEVEYYGPFNGLLQEVFPSPEHFMVVPQYKHPTHPQSIEFTTIFIVRRHKHPVFFIEIKPAGHIKKISDRAAADEQMRQRYDALVEEIDIPILYGVSALGTKFSVYTYESQTKTLTPPKIEKDLRVVKDRAPANWWNLDVLTHEGEQRIRQIVDHVKAMCGGI